ncbi:chromosome segregation protein SMC [Andreprevotia chitinilytica]|uniref:chromosome segregation protein SMC n=1 Tax=Andreprevotia chitinilytica TaxID=396808 RepID=UPI00055866AD|nr:chromosome segregation protein SMC [Andreprevotia chitinilytica]
MRLTHIKLAGFKSFVDPTSIHVPGQRVAICGPNGCGKSNVIDAVRWVLGESSAKQLRGESMQDVIFNGSTSRKPVSRASVELVFDNSEGLAAGQWSQYAEISIKRLLTRQGESSYYINNLQVRRRDITDLFLGTGVGKGGYAIIEQGMITRIIESKPEELRHFLEEAAGVSKYKERRRETEARLADTRDNLARVDDIQQELTRQVDKLQAQAEVAAQYQNLHETIVEKQNLLALQRKLDAARDVENARRDIDTAQNTLESQIADLRAIEAVLETLREEHFTASDGLHNAQGDLYDANAAVARLEQQLLHLRQTRERLTQQLASIKTDLARLAQSRTDIGRENEDWANKHEEGQFVAEEATLAFEEENQRLPELEAALREADAAFQSARDELASARSRVQLAQQQIGHHEKNLATLKARRDKLDGDWARLGGIDADALVPQREALETLQIEIEEAVLALSDTEAQQQEGRERQAALRTEREQARVDVAQLSARIAALQDLLRQSDDAALVGWLERHGLDAMPPLFESLQVEPAWADALEAVLGARLLARMAESAPTEAAPGKQVIALAASAADAAPFNAPGGFTSLLDRVECRDPRWQAHLSTWLGSVWCADSLDAALALRDQLPAGALLVTPEGHRLERLALHFHAAGEGSGLVARKQALQEAETQLQAVEPTLAQLDDDSRALEAELQALDARLRELRPATQQRRDRAAQIERELARAEEAARQAQAQRSQLQDERELVAIQIEEETLALDEAQAMIDTDTLIPLEEALDNTRLAKSEAEAACELQRSRLRQAERRAQEARFAVQSADARRGELARRQDELETQQAVLEERAEALTIELEDVDEGVFDVDFQEAVNVRSEKEQLLAKARDAVNGFAQTMREREAEKQRIEIGLEPARELVNAARLKEQEARIALERFVEELAEAKADEAALREKLGAGMKISSLVAEIGRLSQAVNSLGAVNLAALEELTAARERATYLAAQAADLNAAIETLENAIRRIDRETRTLLQDTYDTVNANLQELFPTLFGGGHAELVLTGDEILDAGMQIMAQPPGKKNSTIHLLSGGEKALTALSLVFSLFRLNPAPFCILDEVDAPLDDANTLRYCELVKKMADRTQFLYISHNRLAMEMAEQLVGVTMQEQGVSRVVSVDIEAALEMRDAVPA